MNPPYKIDPHQESYTYFELYSKLRKMGHGRVESLKRAADYCLEALLSPHHRTYDAFCVEVDLHFLEQCSKPDFQSIDDVVNLHIDLGSPYPSDHYKTEQLCLVYLQLAYCNRKDVFSTDQMQRYENILKQLPPKFEELINAAESRDKLKEYGEKQKREWRKKRDEWKRLNNR